VNIIIIIAVMALTLAVILWLSGRTCMHSYEIIDRQDDTGEAERTYVSRCTKCGKICTKKIRFR
jgi:hypothetical protein